VTRYDLISPRERKDGKTFWVKIGSGFARDAGGFSLVFDALPLPDKDGAVRAMMTEPKPRDGDAPSSVAGDRGAWAASAPRELDDEIPF
jgi:hypothetical protein